MFFQKLIQLLKQRLTLEAPPKPRLQKSRLDVLLLMLSLSLFLVVARFASFNVSDGKTKQMLTKMAEVQSHTKTSVSLLRKPIHDRTGVPLATNIYKKSLFSSAEMLNRSNKDLLRISRDFGLSYKKLKRFRGTKRKFIWLKRHATVKGLEKKLIKWKCCVASIDEPSRVYPFGSSAKGILGFTGIDHNGLSGAEKIFDKDLTMEKQTITVSVDARRRHTVLKPSLVSKPATRGKPFQMSLDIHLQHLAESILGDAMVETKTPKGALVMMDAKSGELLAVASMAGKVGITPKPANLILPITDGLELGSVIKPLIVASAIDSEAVNPDEIFHCENGKMRIKGGTIRDTKQRENLAVPDILKFSSNICMYKLAMKLGRDGLLNVFDKYGLFQKTQLNWPGEFVSKLKNPTTWSEMRFANLAFGQGISMSILQLMRAFAAVVGNGKLVEPSFLLGGNKNTHPPLLKKSTVALMRHYLTGIVHDEDGGAKKAQVPGMRALAKTGTAEKFDINSRSYALRTSSIIGAFPAQNPKYIVMVSLDETESRPAYGGLLAAPVFSSYVGEAVRYLRAKGRLAFLSSGKPDTL